MEFNERKPIYAQIADWICEGVLQNTWKEEERLPSIRELAVELEVNPNTVTRTYALLQDQGIIFNRRGIGYFIAPSARINTLGMLKSEFIRTELPELFRKLEVLEMSIEDIKEIYSENQ